MIEKLKKIVSESFEENIVLYEFDRKFQDYDGWDSLTAMVLIDQINENFNIEIEVEKIGEMSINSLYKILNN